MQLEVELTSREGAAIGLAQRFVADGFRDIVVLGGDGTIGEVVAGCVLPDGSGMRAADIGLSVIHQGTGGDVAHGLGIPKDEAGALAVARSGALRRVDVGIARFEQGDALVRGFLSCANVGMSAEVVELVTGRLKRIGKSGAFAAATLRSLARNRARPMEIRTAEGLELDIDVVDVMAANNRYLGGGMLAAPNAEWDDGLFDLVMIGAARRTTLLRAFPKIYSGRHLSHPIVRVERTASVRLASGDAQRPERVVLDGELVGRTPVTFELLPAALGIRVPV
ncbi:MAG: diacylglycerol kinase catalytic region [Thermoleophilia bacterium]|nr:diacylglycerol kinase catalytic region [Thermoleophilia bacterium]